MSAAGRGYPGAPRLGRGPCSGRRTGPALAPCSTSGVGRADDPRAPNPEGVLGRKSLSVTPSIDGSSLLQRFSLPRTPNPSSGEAPQWGIPALVMGRWEDGEMMGR